MASHENPVDDLEGINRRAPCGTRGADAGQRPTDWATAQNGLGMCLLNVSNFASEAALLPQAKAAFEAATEVFTRENLPLQWAFAENNIGDVHWSLASRGGGKPDYEKAIELYEIAKEGFTEAGYLAPIALTDKKVDLVRQAMAKK